MQKKLIAYIKAVGTETNNLSFGKDEIEKIIEQKYKCRCKNCNICFMER